MSLVTPDTVVIETLGSVTLHPETRKPMGRRTVTSVTVKAQVEIGAYRKRSGDQGLDYIANGVIVFDYTLCQKASYTPKRGDRVTQITYFLTKRVVSTNLYLEDVKDDGAGDLITCALTDRSPTRTPDP